MKRILLLLLSACWLAFSPGLAQQVPPEPPDLSVPATDEYVKPDIRSQRQTRSAGTQANEVSMTAVLTSDSLALVDLYFSTNGPTTWTNRMGKSNWLVGPIANWDGEITIENGRIVNMDLSFKNLSGTLPASLGNLTALRRLLINDNRIGGSLPASLERLTNLQILWAHRNQLSGPIPAELGLLTNLTDLILAYNRLDALAPSLGNLTQLTRLSLGDNQLSGAIPPPWATSLS